MTEPLVGMVTPVYNGARWLDELIVSVRAQTYRDWRLVIVDDGSDDDSLTIAERHAGDDERITAVRGPGRARGAPICRRYGRELLPRDAKYLYFPDADDRLEPELAEVLVARLEDRPDAAAVVCDYSRVDERSEVLSEASLARIAMTQRWVRRLGADDRELPFETIYGVAAPITEATIMAPAAAYDGVGGWPRGRRGFGSIDLLCRLALAGPVLFEPRRLYGYRRRGDQLSKDPARLARGAAGIRELWRRRARANPAVAPVVARGEFFIEHRLASWNGLVAARDRARRGDLLGAARFVFGAVRRYRPSV